MGSARHSVFAAIVFALALQARAQIPPTPANATAKAFNESGHAVVEGHSVPYLIRRLPLNAFPQLPEAIANELSDRDCLIPQTYEAHRPENVVHASLERPGSQDWAVLCSAQG